MRSNDILYFILDSAQIQCYCNSGDNCFNNTCNIDNETDSQCEVVYLPSTEVKLNYLCFIKKEGMLDTNQCGDETPTHYCCNNFNECNRCPPCEIFSNYTDLLMESCQSCRIPPSPSQSPESPLPSNQPLNLEQIVFIVFGCTTLPFLLVIASVVILLVCYGYHQKNQSRSSLESNHIDLDHDMQPVGISSSGGTSSGMNGPRMLRSRTVSHDLHKIRVIGKGRFGEVWLCKPRAEYDHQLIAMKVFQYRHEAAWTREIDIYNTYMLNHNNILKFLGNDRMEFPHTVELCTLFEYHENGTLYEYLKSRESLSFSESHFMGVSFFTGLEYLHRTITAGVQKPGIAHRDIKSRNILVKQDQSLCISDLGMAVKASTSDDGTESVDEEPTNKLSGTKRYMSPEILNGSMDYKKFISYTRSDIYSASLTLWELFACCTINGVHHTYNLPYYNMVPLDPDINQMKECVCILNKRPELPSFWDDNDVS
jgi:hypothetical protein